MRPRTLCRSSFGLVPVIAMIIQKSFFCGKYFVVHRSEHLAFGRSKGKVYVLGPVYSNGITWREHGLKAKAWLSSDLTRLRWRDGCRLPMHAWNSNANHMWGHAAPAGPHSHRRRTAGHLRPQRPAAQQDKTAGRTELPH